MYIAAAATEIGERPGTISISTALRAICVAALWTILGKPRFEQNLDMKSPVVMRSTEVSRAFKMSLKHLPISLLLILLTAQISLNVRGTPSWRQAMYKQAEAIASLDRPEEHRSFNRDSNNNFVHFFLIKFIKRPWEFNKNLTLT